MSGTPAFQFNAFQSSPLAFQEGIPPPTNFLTTTANLNLPINCVMAGQQKEPIKKAMGLNGAIGGPIRGIFNE